MASVGLLTMSDGRPGVHREVEPFARQAEDRIATVLMAAGHHVVRAEAVVASNDAAVAQGRRVADARPDLTIFNIPVWAFPHFTMLAANETPGPLLLMSDIDPAYPGMVGVLAAGGALDQVGRVHGRLCGGVGDPAVQDLLAGHVAAGTVVRRLKGSTFGRIGGRPMGMYTAVANPDQWMARFGIDVEEIDQYELVRRAELADPRRVAAGRRWLEQRCAAVHYDGDRLTPERLERQLGLYHAVRDLADERSLAFCGIKAQPELTDHYATTDVAEAFLNDPYDWEGPKQPLVCSTEADMDGALTMLMLGTISGTPSLFADVRHHHADLDVWDLCNSGQHATWFAARSDDPEENLGRVHLHPQEFYFPAGGATVHHLAAPGDMTFARLTRLDGRYRMHVLRGSFEQFGAETDERLMRASTFVWPHAFAHFDGVAASELLGRYGSNHIHAVPGDHVATLRAVCRLLDLDFDGFGAAA